MNSEESDPGILESAYRTVTPSYGSHEDTGMDLIGWIVFLGAMTLLFPLVPLFLVFVLGAKALRAIRSTVQGSDE